MSFKSFKDSVIEDLTYSSLEHIGLTMGLLGAYNGGHKIDPNQSTIMEDTNLIGKEWQVQASKVLLFHVTEGPQAPAECDTPSAKDLRRRLAETMISLNDAETAYLFEC